MGSLRTPWLASCFLALPVSGQGRPAYESPPISYSEQVPDDAVSRLQERLKQGESQLPNDPTFGFLPGLLRALDIPVSSQTLVFSKTSLQVQRISPRHPRAVYFNDDVYVGYVPGGRWIEISTTDPRNGPMFYTLAQRAGKPQFVRKTSECLACHGAGRTRQWPGHLVRSVHATEDGHVVTHRRTFVTTQDSPFAERWGGWYVTGRHEPMPHMGNVTEPAAPPGEKRRPEDTPPPAGHTVEALGDRIDGTRYPAPHSDIVALMVLEHQTMMHNLLAQAGYRVRAALHLQATTDQALGERSSALSDHTRRVIRDVARELVEFLLFKNEPPLPVPIRGTSGFAAEFAARGPRDPKGRSLRAFDLEKRLFRFPCSYLIYSPAFDALPPPVLAQVYSRLRRVLGGRLSRRAWRLSRDQRQAILDILLATKKNLPADWVPTRVR